MYTAEEFLYDLSWGQTLKFWNMSEYVWKARRSDLVPD